MLDAIHYYFKKEEKFWQITDENNRPIKFHFKELDTWTY